MDPTEVMRVKCNNEIILTFQKIIWNLVQARVDPTEIDESYAVPIDKDPLVVSDGPITRSRAKKIKEAMAGLVQSTWAELAYSPSKALTFKMGFKEEEPALIHVIQVKEQLV